MAKLRVAPETLMARMLPGVEGEVIAVGFNRWGDIVLEIAGPGVPATDGEVTATITIMFDAPPLAAERIELKAA